jgi:hypothetical protein
VGAYDSALLSEDKVIVPLDNTNAPSRRGSPQGDGLGTTPVPGDWTMAMVNNQCPECAYGSIDLALTGNGRWKVEWYPLEVRSTSGSAHLTGMVAP